MADVIVHKKDNVWAQVICEDRGVLQHLAEEMTFRPKDIHFDPRVKAKQWDGKIRLLHKTTGLMYFGLVPRLNELCQKYDYDLEVTFDDFSREFSEKEAREFIETLNIPEEYTPRDYQVHAFVQAIRNRREVHLLTTGGGKSLLIYLCIRWLVQYERARSLVIVPTTGLVEQMYSDFAKYGCPEPETTIHRINASHGSDRRSMAPIQVSTWQSLGSGRVNKRWFRKFGAVFGDEAHQFGSTDPKELTKLMEMTTEISFKLGLTGTLDFDKVDPLVVQGLFGPVRVIKTLKQLTDEGYTSKLNVKCIILRHTEENRKILRKATYDKEIAYLVDSQSRNRYIVNLARSLPGTNLIIVDANRHCEMLKEMLDEYNEKETFLFYGKVKSTLREEYRLHINNTPDDFNVVASFGVFQMGIDIPKLQSMIFGISTRSKYRTLQSIGRLTRKTDEVFEGTVFDLSDDLRPGQTKKMNHTLRHLVEHRLPYYTDPSNDLPYQVYKVQLNE